MPLYMLRSAKLLSQFATVIFIAREEINHLVDDAQRHNEETDQTRCHQGVVYHAVYHETDEERQSGASHPEGLRITLAHHAETVAHDKESNATHNGEGDDAAFQ